MLTPGGELGQGRYALERHLGSGGMASVWLATDRRLHRQVAIKVMSDILAGDERYLERFRREARAAASLSHRNVVALFDYGVEEGRPFLVMAFVPGGSLKDRLAAGDAPEPRRLARELLSALAHVHAAGIVHRDVKPGNVLIGDDGAAHLTDFGIARPQDATSMTQTGVVLGTQRYLAPEVAHGEPATEASDLYSAGCVVRAVAGEPAPPDLEDLITALTAADPSARPASAEAALLRLTGDGTTATVAQTAAARPSPAHRPPWLAPLAALTAVAVVAAVVVLAAGGGGPDRSPARVAPASAPLDRQLDGLDRAIDAQP
jgi:serine/threonine protein kinase